MALTGDSAADKEEEPSVIPPPLAEASPSVSVINVILLYLILLGVGTLGGFGMFYFLYMGRCSEVLQEVQSASEEHWKGKYERAWEDKQLCLADTHAKEELFTMQGRLAAQDALRERREALMIQQEDSLKQLTVMQDTINVMQSQISEKEKDGMTLHEVMTTMESQLELHRSQVKECTYRLPALAEDARRLQSHVVERNLKTCQMEFGKGPYFVEFHVLLPSSSGDERTQAAFEVQLSPVADLPHTIVTFLTLVDLQLYDGTRFTMADDRQLQGGAPHLAASTHQGTKLLDRYRKFGLDAESPLAFAEQSQKMPPVQYTFSLAGNPRAGPAFAINMVDNVDVRALTEPCFGKVVQGFGTLERIQAAMNNQSNDDLENAVEILSVRLNRRPRKQTA